MNILEVGAGESIDRTVRVLCRWIPCRAIFNGIELRSRTGSTPAKLLADFHRLWEERAAAYRTSPEGIAAADEREREVAASQAEADRLIALASDLIRGDARAAIDWLVAYQPHADNVGVTTDKEKVLQAFLAAGWVVNDCVGNPLVQVHPLVFARWLIGQGMAGIELLGAPHPVLLHFAEQWRKMAADSGQAS